MLNQSINQPHFQKSPDSPEPIAVRCYQQSDSRPIERKSSAVLRITDYWVSI